MSAPHGIVVLDKPAGITSRDAVDTACKVLKTREIGHCGTLDPLAKGVLVLVVGRARRLQELLARSRKVYVARIRLGANSETDDAEGPITPVEPLPPPPTHDALVQALAPFRGEIDQRPPRYSAVKVDGERLYDLARRGQGIDAPMRRVKIYEIELTKYAWPDVELRVACAGGTYVRAIARDLGAALGTGGYLADLTRTESGGFELAEAIAPEALTPGLMLPLENALRHFPRVDIAASQAVRLANGATVHADLPAVSLAAEETIFGWVDGRAVALLKKQGPNRVRSQRLLVTVHELQRLAEEELARGGAAAVRTAASYGDDERR
ncbi:MAG TPA: tRNA pseudouridine(55) synthase TruB [Planctomycetota bacterium]|jgi:tRNA pseudouridine55 synthase|nr:tRNA pseudouridine(55) synthase TruB [Planctomycetota bacterium]